MASTNVPSLRYFVALAILACLGAGGHGPGETPSHPSQQGTTKNEISEISSDRVQDWESYNRATAGNDPEDDLIDTLGKYPTRKGSHYQAIDLGAGGGRDTLAIAKKGWNVLAVDVTPKSLEKIEKDSIRLSGHVTTKLASFQGMKLGGGSADLVNASYSLPFVSNEAFPSVWKKIVSALKPGGRFVGTFFGPKDTWAKTKTGMNFHDQASVKKLVRDSGLEVESIDEDEYDDGSFGARDRKHWDVITLVARKP